MGNGTIVTSNAYDGRGRLAYTSLPANGTPPTECVQTWGTTTPTCTPNSGTFTQFDGLGRPTAVVQAGGATTTSQYRADETLIADPAGVTRLNTGDRFGNLTSVLEDPTGWYGGALSGTLNYLTSYVYDKLNGLTGVTQGSLTRSFTYDSLKRLVQAVNPESGTINYAYDDSGNLATRTANPSTTKTVTTGSTYDGMNRISGKTYSGSTAAVSYTYDAGTSKCATGQPGPNFLGRLTSVSNGNSTTYGCYDQVGRVTWSTQTTNSTDYTFAYAYDLSGAPASETYPSLRVIKNLLPDAAGRVQTVRGTLGGVDVDYASSIGYEPTGPIRSLTLWNGVTENWTFGTPQKQPTALAVAKSGSNLLSLGWGYGTGANPDLTNNGNVTSASIAPAGGTTFSQSYTYDPVSRLKTATETGGTGWQQYYVYDPFGNRVLLFGAQYYIPGGSSTPTVLHDAAADMAAIYTGNRWSAGSVQYDNNVANAAGNMTALPDGSTHAYDAENRQTSATTAVGTTTYSYDGDGRRVQKVSGGVMTTYVFLSKTTPDNSSKSGPFPPECMKQRWSCTRGSTWQ